MEFNRNSDTQHKMSWLCGFRKHGSFCYLVNQLDESSRLDWNDCSKFLICSLLSLFPQKPSPLPKHQSILQSPPLYKHCKGCHSRILVQIASIAAFNFEMKYIAISVALVAATACFFVPIFAQDEIQGLPDCAVRYHSPSLCIYTDYYEPLQGNCVSIGLAYCEAPVELKCVCSGEANGRMLTCFPMLCSTTNPGDLSRVLVLILSQSRGANTFLKRLIRQYRIIVTRHVQIRNRIVHWVGIPEFKASAYFRRQGRCQFDSRWHIHQQRLTVCGRDKRLGLATDCPLIHCIHLLAYHSLLLSATTTPRSHLFAYS